MHRLIAFVLALTLIPLAARADSPVTIGPVSPPQVTLTAQQPASAAASSETATASPLSQLKVPQLERCVDQQKQGCLASLTLGPSVGMTLFQLSNAPGGKAVIAGPSFAGGGGSLALNFWKAPDGNYMAHVGLGVIVGGGVINGLRTGGALASLSLGFGGFDHIPLFLVGPSLLIPADGQHVLFALSGNAAAMTLLTEF